MMKKFLFAVLTLALALCLLPAISQPAAATEVTEVTNITKVQFDGEYPALGQNISQLAATVNTDGVVLEEICVYNLATGEKVTEGQFETGKRYEIHYVFAPTEGYQFPETVTLYYNGYRRNLTWESESRIVYKFKLTTCEYFSNINLTMTLLQVGMGPDDIIFSYPADATYHVEDVQLFDITDGSQVTGTLQADRSYQLMYTVVANDGYLIEKPVQAYLNEARTAASIDQDGTSCRCSTIFSPLLEQVNITGIAQMLKAGYKVGTPTVYTGNSQINATNKRWLNAQMEAYTDVIRGDETYYLAFDLYVVGAGGGWDNLIVNTGDRETTVKIIDRTHASVYIRYTPVLPVTDIRITTIGAAEGMPTKDVSAKLSPNVRIKSLRTPSAETFKTGEVYYINFDIEPEEGYYIETINTTVYLNGVETEWTNHNDYISVSMKLDTRILIKTAKLNISGVGVGKNIAKVKLTEASGSKFEIFHKAWSATNTSSTKFLNGERYYLAIALDAEDGYRFSTDTVITVGGKKAFDISTGFQGDYLYGTYEIEYITELTSVKLPAMPKSIQLGATLPTNFKVSSSAKYTMESVWLSMSHQQQAVIAGKNDCYVLTYVVYAKDGCEFTADTVFYVDGKKVKPVALNYYSAQIMKPYNVGLSEIDRIDLTVTEPADGMKPETATVPTGAPYTLLQQAWVYNTTGKLQDGTSSVTTFQNYKYHFLATELQTKTGYIFADKVTVYINGIKFTVLDEYNLGTAYQLAVSFGKLGEIPQLTAPEVAKDGFTIRWDTVRNADFYEVYRATSKSGSYTKVATVQETTWADVPVKGKTYYYKVKALFTPDTTKNSGYSNLVSIAYKCDAPVITVENGTTGKPVITWEKVSGAKQYTVYRATSEAGKYSKLGTSKTNAYTDSKAKTGTTYFYKVIANASSSTYNSGYSNIESCACVCGAPTVTVKIDVATGKPSLSWKKIDGATGYRILRQLPGEEDFTVIKEQTAVTFTDTTAPIDTNCVYLVQVMGKTSALDSQMSKEISATSGLAKPVLKTSVDTNGKPQITWTAIEGAVTYEIYRSTKSTKSYSLLTTVEVTGYTDESVAPGKTYYYKVVAIGAVSKSAESSYAKLSGKCATPTISVAINEESGKPQLTWEKIEGAKKYTVYRATSQTGKYSKLGTTTKLTYTDSKATVGKTYYYKIVANPSSSSYNSAYSNIESCLTICAKPVVKATTVTATGKPTLSWKKVTGAKEYWIFLDVNGQPQLLTTTTKLSFTDEAAVPGETRTYAVWAVNADPVCNSAMDAYTVTATCAQPKVKGAVGATGKPELTITAVEGATRYVIYRSTSKTKGYTVIDTTEGLTFTDTTATKGKTYYYKVVAICEETESTLSAYAKVKSK